MDKQVKITNTNVAVNLLHKLQKKVAYFEDFYFSSSYVEGILKSNYRIKDTTCPEGLLLVGLMTLLKFHKFDMSNIELLKNIVTGPTVNPVIIGDRYHNRCIKYIESKIVYENNGIILIKGNDLIFPQLLMRDDVRVIVYLDYTRNSLELFVNPNHKIVDIADAVRLGLDKYDNRWYGAIGDEYDETCMWTCYHRLTRIGVLSGVTK